ncbi:MAG: BamA/TamA family outer membrane protein [Bacteroidetes bacterium]|nr:BamA/TamA family outer membrane protein [Bacteroidota bacterium]
MTHSKSTKYFLFLICLLMTACSGTRYLPKGEKLYSGAEIRLESSVKIKNKGFIKSTAEEALRPKPNQKVLWMRQKLWLYGIAGQAPKSKFNKWLKNLGEPPVLISQVKPRLTSDFIDAKLFNIGIFKSSTAFKIIEKKRKAKIIYTSNIHKPYIVKEVIYATWDINLNNFINSEKDNSLIKPGDDYNLNMLKNERIRIDAFMKKNGYFYFSPEYLMFKADTAAADQSVTLSLKIKDDVPYNALIVFFINRVFIDQDFSLDKDDVTISDTVKSDNCFFLGKEADMKIRPDVISRSIYLKKYERYSREKHEITLNRLMSMGNFKFVRLKFSDSDTSAVSFLDVTILMTPMPKRTFRAEVEVVSKSNNYMGPRLDVSFLNRNTFKGAEFLKLSLAGSFEGQFFGKGENLYSYSINPQMELTFPRFVVPFNLNRTNSKFIPKTNFLLSYNYTKRIDYFDMHTLQFIYGFKWKNDFKKQHELNPISISYTSILNKSDKFTAILATNPFLKKSYEEQFIAGATYSFIYDEQSILDKKAQYYFNFNAEVAGNLISFSKILAGESISADHPLSVIGSVYSQFAKISLDARTYYNFENKNKLVLRAYMGVARPYGNSSTLPYIRQFFSGGPNSIRAFQINSIGPGTYHQNADNKGFLQLGGDVKLELNAEYRFNIFRFFKGGLFVDGGNIWLLPSNPSTIGSSFLYSQFIKEIAVGAGFGLRIDVSFFILRFDLATPLRKPWLQENKRWVIDQINVLSSAWRKDNLILNVAIGYPF